MSDKNSRLKKYYKSIKSWLPCSTKQNKLILDKIKDDIAAYLEENPDVGYDEIERRFGTPQQIAAACVDEMGMSELLHRLRLRKKVLGTIRNIVLCILAVLAVIAVLSLPRVDSIEQVPATTIEDYPSLQREYESLCRKYDTFTIETESNIQVVTVKNLWGSWELYILPCFAAKAPTVPGAGMQSFAALMHVLAVWEEENIFTRMSPLEVSINTNMLPGDYTGLSEDFRTNPDPAVKTGEWIVFEELDCNDTPSCFVYYWVGTSIDARELSQEYITQATFQWKYVIKICKAKFILGSFTIEKMYTVNA